MKFYNNEFFRFLIVGGLNTAITYAIYFAGVSLHIHYMIAYSFAFIIGIMMSYTLNTAFVFKSTFAIRKALRFPMVYFIQYILGVMLLYILIDTLHVDKKIAALLLIFFTVPLTFLLSRFILQDTDKRS